MIYSSNTVPQPSAGLEVALNAVMLVVKVVVDDEDGDDNNGDGDNEENKESKHVISECGNGWLF